MIQRIPNGDGRVEPALSALDGYVKAIIRYRHLFWRLQEVPKWCRVRRRESFAHGTQEQSRREPDIDLGGEQGRHMEYLAYQAQARQLFTEMVTGRESRLDLGRAALLIASEEYPGLDILRYVARLEAMAAAVRPVVGATDAPQEQVEHLNTYLFVERGFRGNTQGYYDPRNSFLNDVLDRKLGIPITISVVYMEVGRRVGMPLQGVGMPGHFLVKYPHPEADIYIDPFNKGQILSRQGCEELLQQVYGEPVPFEESFLAPVTKKQILARILMNLKAIYLHIKHHRKALATVERLLLIQPDAEQEMKDRATLRNLIGMLN
jgi:regulator of sirC expression with transglutaminase-like and TPR domain